MCVCVRVCVYIYASIFIHKSVCVCIAVAKLKTIDWPFGPSFYTGLIFPLTSLRNTAISVELPFGRSLLFFGFLQIFDSFQKKNMLRYLLATYYKDEKSAF